VPFPSPPWQLRGDLWLSLFRVPTGATDAVAGGWYGVAFVDYRDGSVLTYRELVVARAVRGGVVPRLTITAIWVDSEPSRDGGRALWAIPKELAELQVVLGRAGPVAHTTWSADIGRAPVAAARFISCPPPPLLRTPYSLTVLQHRPESGEPVLARASGSAKALPCLARWDFAVDGPLAWLRGRTPVGSLRLSDFRMTFGG